MLKRKRVDAVDADANQQIRDADDANHKIRDVIMFLLMFGAAKILTGLKCMDIKTSTIEELESFVKNLSTVNTKITNNQYATFYSNMIKVINTIMCNVRQMITSDTDITNLEDIKKNLFYVNRVISLFCYFITKIRLHRITGMDNDTIKLYIVNIIKNVQVLNNNIIYIKNKFTIKYSNDLKTPYPSMKILDDLTITLKNILLEIRSPAFFNVNSIPISHNGNSTTVN